jgi:hypothetical protein
MREGTPTILEALQAKLAIRQRNRMHEEAAAAARRPKPATRRPFRHNTVILPDDDSLRGRLIAHLPRRPYCADDPREGLKVRSIMKAIQYRHIQFNGPAAFEWLHADVDRPGAYYADSDANLPPANIVMVKRENGHAHLSWLLASPVLKLDYGHKRPIDYYRAVQRGMTNRMDADKQFGGLMLKNPLHPDWLVDWRHDRPYTLDELNDWLFNSDKRFEPRAQADTQWDAGRNIIIFDDLRAIAYREVRQFKRHSQNREQFRSRLAAIADGINLQFHTPLDAHEIRAIVRRSQTGHGLAIQRIVCRNGTQQTRQKGRSKTMGRSSGGNPDQAVGG